MKELVHSWLRSTNIDSNYIAIFRDLIIVLGILIVAYLINFIVKKIIVVTLHGFAKRSKTTWDDFLFDRRVFQRLSHLAPAIVIYFAFPHFFPEEKALLYITEVAAKVYMLFTVLLSLDSFLSALHDIYQTLDISKIRPIKGYIQVGKIVIYIVGSIFALSILLNKSPMYLLTGLGALTAVLLLVFKDVILGFVGSIQLSANDMIRPGDWITMSKAGADGTVVEINLTTIKVQNWDKTITTIPTYNLITDSFQNWRGMQESGVRRIKKSILIDSNTVKFCNDILLDKFKNIQLITSYIESKKEEIKNYNSENNINTEVLANGRRQTNIGIFRAYLEAYFKANEKINQEMTVLVRQLEPVEKGLPIEFILYSNIQDSTGYESLQADIFDHILAVLPEFELSLFQNPTGRDFQLIVNK
ncbi:MAG: mechanosensitive ion channel domain-containing protein [Bacteroidota bacterium]